ncbi:flippase-like domain-containing protein [Candidatus Gracilibacteria bacterium]|nr:flippase-like domain-containing protein [Candidatus Gracilibacteria bacterium]
MTSKTRTIVVRILYVTLIAAVVYFLGKEIAGNWGKIRAFHFDFNWSLVGFASLAYAGSFIIFALAWGLLLKGTGNRLPFIDTLTYFFVTQPAKYIPGKIWLPVMRNHFCKKHGISLPLTFLAAGIESVFEILAGTYISIIAILHTPLLGQWGSIGTIGLVIVGVILMIPRVFYFCVNAYLKLLRQPPLPAENHVTFLQLLSIQSIYIFGMALYGLSQALFLISFTSIPMSALPYLTSMGAFTYVASILGVTPSGLGVREYVWIVALRKMLEHHISIIFAFVSRLWTIAIELILAFIFFIVLMARKSNDPDPKLK